MTAAKATKEIKIDSSCALHLKEGDVEKECKTADSLELHQALTRRGLAVDLVGLVTFSVHQAYVSDLFNKIQTNPPPGFHAPSTTHLLRADRAAFGRMAEWAQNGIQMRPDGTKPLDSLMARARADAEIQFFMLPTPMPPPAPKKRAWDDAFGNQWQKQTGEEGKGKGKQKGKTKSRSTTPARSPSNCVPQGVWPATTRTVGCALRTTSTPAPTLPPEPSVDEAGTFVPRKGATSSTPRVLTRPSEMRALALRRPASPRHRRQ